MRESANLEMPIEEKLKKKENKRTRRSERKNNVFFFDYTLLFVVIFLLAFGLLMVYSTSSYSAMMKNLPADFYFIKQLKAVIVGLVLMGILAFFDYHIYRELAPFAYIASFALCVLVLLKGTEINGSKRWLYIMGISFQPSEFAKAAILVVMACIVAGMSKKINKIKYVAILLGITAGLAGFVAIENLTNGIIIGVIAISIMFVASEKYSHYIAIAVMAVGLILIAIFAVGYRSSRIDAWLHPETAEKGYQVMQGLYAIGSGGLFGKGLGESVQKLGFVPEAQNDMIFSIICEELGLFGAIAVILLYVILCWRCVMIALNAKDLLGSLLTVGVMTHILVQVILNIAVVSNTIINTGVSLPFISYGGTSVVLLLAEIGIVLNVSRGIKMEENTVI